MQCAAPPVSFNVYYFTDNVIQEKTFCMKRHEYCIATKNSDLVEINKNAQELRISKTCMS